MPQELMRGLKGLVVSSTSNGDYELAQRKAEETGLSHHHHCLFFKIVFHNENEDINQIK
ncbi:hypothetical protein AtEden1_Chr00c002g0322471 [Arabidopsis thaliana]